MGDVGGKVDDGESPIIAMLREFKEESGYSDIIDIMLLYVFKTDGFKYFNYLGIVQEEFVPELSWETSNYRWVTLRELNKIDNIHFGLQNLLDKKYELLQNYGR